MDELKIGDLEELCVACWVEVFCRVGVIIRRYKVLDGWLRLRL
jgi:hypothetical protein